MGGRAAYARFRNAFFSPVPSQPKLDKLIPALRMTYPARHRQMPTPFVGPLGRLRKLRINVAAVIKLERIELPHHIIDETRQYTERLLSEAVVYGDCHRPTMELADFWLQEKQLIHKLFKVLVPRYKDIYNDTYTRMLKAPRVFPSKYPERSVLELKGNPFPPLINPKPWNKNLLHNVLLEEARREHHEMTKTLRHHSGDNNGEPAETGQVV
ncbi:unnamed protein product [Cyprideis torosa]|uniref:Large ribosomal subunit protein bL17m n=1 Tax=Cyprideis torosa TaxID=163714 RepID=A0A7R8W5M9_9CRUS|nr:unnamed protein product [Cyprideis torosa]CAG0880591.1 unnamed protein product [Cyprideis torosa]